MTGFLIFELKRFEYLLLLLRLTLRRDQHHPSLSTGGSLLYIISIIHPGWYHWPVSNLGSNRGEYITLLNGRIVVANHLSRWFAKSRSQRSVGVWISGTCYLKGIVLDLRYSRLLSLPHGVGRLVRSCTNILLRLRFSWELSLVLKLRKFRASNFVSSVFGDYLTRLKWMLWRQK